MRRTSYALVVIATRSYDVPAGPVHTHADSASRGRQLGSAARRERAFRTTAGSVVVHIGGRLDLRKPP